MTPEAAPVRAEILETGNPQIKSARITINAPAAEIFELLVDPKRHKNFDGTETIQSNISGPARLSLGSKFGMHMKLGIHYRILNKVVESED